MNIFSKIRHFDAYTKPLEDFRIKTLTGGAVTLISGVVMVLLFISELKLYLSTEVVQELLVDSRTDMNEKVQIKFDANFHKMPCSFITVDAMDVSGEHQSDLQHSVWKIRLASDGTVINKEEKPEKQELNQVNASSTPGTDVDVPKCGSCYGAESPGLRCCATCADVKEAYSRKGWQLTDIETIDQCKQDDWVRQYAEHKDEGCRVYGTVHVSKVAGNFHIAPGVSVKDAHSHVHDLHSLGANKFDSSVTITHLSFGKTYPGKQYPLDGKNFRDETGGTMYQFYAKVVPTLYIYIDKGEIFTHQFSVTKHQKQVVPGVSEGLPGLFVQYEFSPLMVKFSERQQSFTHFLVSVCAIVGGVFTVASLIDSFIYHSSKVLQQKIDLGKAS